MHFMFALFNYRDGDPQAEERNYLERHVALGRSLPRLGLYYTGRLREHRGHRPAYVRGALVGFPDLASFRAAFSSPAGAELAADGEAHLKDVRMLELDGEVIVPFESRTAGRECFVMAAEFGLEASCGLEAAERRYLTHHVGLARRLPGLRNYIIGRAGAHGGEKPDRFRLAFIVFDSFEAFREAYRSPLGQELARDEDATIRDALVYRLDARVEA